MKYVDAKVVFQEVPDEITLAISISGCTVRCPDCHSMYLWDNIGTELDRDELYKLISANKGITCVCFMGGIPYDIQTKSFWLKTRFPELKVAWYTGLDGCSKPYIKYLDYVKYGQFIKEKGGLDNPNTNQKFYKIEKKDGIMYYLDWTYKFQKQNKQQ